MRGYRRRRPSARPCRRRDHVLYRADPPVVGERTAEVSAYSSVLALSATRRGARWTASTWPHPLTRNQAVTALRIAEYLAAGRAADDPFVVAWGAELPHG